MKSYFAKLAARATLANTPAAPANSRKIGDPFENDSPPEDSSGQLPASSTHRSTDETNAYPAGRLAREGGRVENAEDLATALRPLLRPTASTAERSSATEEKASGLGSRELQAGAADRVNADPGSNALSLSRLQPPPPAPALSNKSDEGSTQRSGDTDDSEARLAEIQSEQSLLLRKADAFMEQLFHRRSRSESVAGVDSSTELPTASRQVIEPDQTTRLRPRPANARTFEQEADQPSLVIGNLTIEVAAPAPAPAASRPSLVVVRGSGRSRNGVPSSRRFGLGQF